MRDGVHAGAGSKAAGVIVDALLGTGFHGEPRPEDGPASSPPCRGCREDRGARRPVGGQRVNRCGGRGGRHGPKMPVVLPRATGWGRPLEPGRGHCGRVVVADIGIPPQDGRGPPRAVLAGWGLQDPVPGKGAKAATKYTDGAVLIVGGARGFSQERRFMSGAGRSAGTSAGDRVGGDAARRRHRSSGRAVPEVMVRPLPTALELLRPGRRRGARPGARAHARGGDRGG